MQRSQFFTVHMSDDVRHSQECGELIQKLSSEEQEPAAQSALQDAQLAWQFLDGVQANRKASSQD